MSGDVQLVLMIAAMHLVGVTFAAVLIVYALRTPPPAPPNQDWGSDGGWGQRPVGPAPWAPDGGVPLPDAQPARVRLREHRRLAELLPRPERRPAREPVRRPVRTH